MSQLLTFVATLMLTILRLMSSDPIALEEMEFRTRPCDMEIIAEDEEYVYLLDEEDNQYKYQKDAGQEWTGVRYVVATVHNMGTIAYTADDFILCFHMAVPVFE